jgi:hypothetical protein
MSMQSGYSLERMERYRTGAVEAVNLALPCMDADLREAYLSIAKTWTELADKIERGLRAKSCDSPLSAPTPAEWRGPSARQGSEANSCPRTTATCAEE